MKIFLIAGKAGSGKSEVAKYIKEYYIYKLKKCAVTQYSKYIKKFAMEIGDWDGSDSNKPRKLLQEIGDVIRHEHPLYFPNNMINDIGIYSKFVDVLVVSDVRMPEEIEKIKENYDEVHTVYVENQFGPSKLSVEEQAHITERALENYTDFDYIMANDTLDTLKDKVFKFLEGIND